jgi:hypothetical protein
MQRSFFVRTLTAGVPVPSYALAKIAGSTFATADESVLRRAFAIQAWRLQPLVPEEDIAMRRSSRRSASGRFGFLGWLVLGAGLASLGFTLFDPARGAARRAMLRERTSSTVRRIGGQTRGRLLDASSRVRGRVQKLRARLSEGEVPDPVLEERVRAQIGRAVSHPGALRVSAVRGCVEITGPVLAGEVEDLVEGIRAVRGVKDVVERFDVHEEAASEPSLQSTTDFAATRFAR